MVFFIEIRAFLLHKISICIQIQTMSTFLTHTAAGLLVFLGSFYTSNGVFSKNEKDWSGYIILKTYGGLCLNLRQLFNIYTG